LGRDPELLARESIERVLPADARVYPNVRWNGPTRPGGPARDGETDIVIVLPDDGVLTVEVKGGTVTRDGFGRWYAGARALDESPFAQVEAGKWVLQQKMSADARWRGDPPRMLHAVAFPEADRASLDRAGMSLGTDAPLELVIDRADIRSVEASRAALDRVLAWWAGDGSRDRRLSAHALEVIEAVLEPAVSLRPMLSGDIVAGEEELLVPTNHQLGILTTLRSKRRAAIEGGAGSGKTLVAIEKARALAAVHYNVLFVCFNQPLSRAVAQHPDLAPHVASGRVTVSTFHELCRRLGQQAGTLPPQPAKPGAEWFSTSLPAALEAAIPTVGGAWQALIVDEGQDFDASWLESLELLLSEPGEDVFYLFHDPAQAIYRESVVGRLGLEEFPLPDNCRNARPIHELAYRFYSGDLDPAPLREDGREPTIVQAEPGAPTLDALRTVLQDLVQAEGVERSQIAVLTGVALHHSDVWRQHRFKGDLILWNGSVDDAGDSLGLPADRVVAQPPKTILCETIHRFKGLERDVVVLVELRPDDERVEKLLYVGATRAKHHLVVIAPPGLAARLAQGPDHAH